ncbi:MAG TPA: hypothetical protein PLD10_15990 [Rhodopila sp.]|nr:hypothetical protein [Rhodopila sp.]
MPKFTNKDFKSSFPSDQIARRLIFEAVIEKTRRATQRIADAIAKDFNAKVDEFFVTLTEFMGQQEDMLDILGDAAEVASPDQSVPEIPGLGHWRPLDLEYVKRKGNDLFWLYSGAALPKKRITLASLKKTTKAADSAAFIEKLRKRLGLSPSLIDYLKKKRGLRAFGPVAVKIIDESYEPFRYITEPVGGKESITPRTRQDPYTRDKKVTRPVAGILFNIQMTLWPNLKSADLSNVELALVRNGFLDKDQAVKLLNIHHDSKAFNRPLMRPWMAYYSQFVLPDVIRSVLKEKSRDGVSISSGRKSIGSL